MALGEREQPEHPTAARDPRQLGSQQGFVQSPPCRLANLVAPPKERQCKRERMQEEPLAPGVLRVSCGLDPFAAKRLGARQIAGRALGEAEVEQAVRPHDLVSRALGVVVHSVEERAGTG